MLRFQLISVTAVLVVAAAAVSASTELAATVPLILSDQATDFDQAYKPKLVALNDGTQVLVYGDAIEDIPDHYVYDLRGDTERPARDVFVRICPAAADCALPASWSTPLNISATADRSSIDSDWQGTGMRLPYHGDSDNPHIFASGQHVVVTWADNYCPGGTQRIRVYGERGDREIPFRCVYAAHASADHADAAAWRVDRLTDGSRDAKQDNSRGLSSGAWNMVWQEDPLGLQPGEAEGPGDGASGAKVSHGTDIWYSYTANIDGATGDIGVWTAPVRVTDNLEPAGIPGDADPVLDGDGLLVPDDRIDTGISGASRPNLALIGGSKPPSAVVVYEETKGSQGEDEGKFVRFHSFPFNAPPAALEDRRGCVVSTPSENARRARVVRQMKPGEVSGLRWVLLWRQGEFTQGGPADVMARLGYQGLSADQLRPAVDPGCAAPDYLTAIALDNEPPLNISSNSPTATTANLADASHTNILENARAHRAVLRGDALHFAYIYTPDWAVAENTDLENYDLYLRRYDGAADRWHAPQNLSRLPREVNALEPRLVGTPGSGPGCADPANPTDPRDCQNPDVLFAAWATETNVYGWLESGVPLDLYITRSADAGATFAPVLTLAATEAAESGLQMRATPDGSLIGGTWSATAEDGSTDAMYAVVSAIEVPDATPDSPRLLASDDSTFGCVLKERAGFDPTLLIVLTTLAVGRLLHGSSGRRCVGTSRPPGHGHRGGLRSTDQ